jgi:uncharacterized membrane protein
MQKKILFAGETWVTTTTHVKGFDTFSTSSYGTGYQWLQAALESDGYLVDHLPNHLAIEQFPFVLEKLKQYDCVILSDIGSNTLLLPTGTFDKSERMPNRCNLLRDYVLGGGALLMIGGYMTFCGIEGKGKWQDTAVADVLPVLISSTDDRIECCEGVIPVVEQAHEALRGIPSSWPPLLGFNKTTAKPGSDVPVTVCGSPLIAFSTHGQGRSAVFTSDCAPHWLTPEFIGWDHYNRLWQGIIGYITG